MPDPANVPSNIEAALRQAFETALAGAVGNTAYDNQGFDPKGKEKWYAFHFMPNQPEVATLGADGEDRHAGIVQIDLNIPLGKGKANLDADLNALSSAFTAGARKTYDLTSVTIKSCGRNGNGSPVRAWFRFYVTIAWEARIPRQS